MLSGRKQALATGVSILAVASLLLAGCSAPSPDDPNNQDVLPGDAFADLDPIELVASDISPEGASAGRAMLAFQAEVTEKTGGKVTFENFWSSSLFPTSDILTSVGAGLADISSYVLQYGPQELPGSHWFTAAGSMSAKSFPGGYLQSMGATVENYKATGLVREELAAHNLVDLSTNGGYPTDMICNDSITTLQEAAGKSVRTGGTPWQDEAEALGMTNVFIPVSDAYEGFQRGLIDCFASSVPAFRGSSLWEVAKHYLPVGFTSGIGFGWIMNKDTWESLPLSVQQVFHDALPILLSGVMEANLQDIKVWASEGPTEHGIVFEDVSELTDVIGKYQRDLVASLPASAPASVADPQGLVDGYAARLEDWAAIVETQMGFEVDNEQTSEELATAQLESVDKIDWEAYRKLLAEALAPYRPTK